MKKYILRDYLPMQDGSYEFPDEFIYVKTDARLLKIGYDVNTVSVVQLLVRMQ